eukprot:CAMPEP_0175758746 /NCGR_PEP_ID=MMETSP0097-20121207/65180_1 /TAXON_ID=311494 /ORGANISM="Alexandrium monilatum, Strain CCMP3105" /LENGTH=202 /DNA_ID=CAMNT_0017068053 /DNA_START=24 /DNA_END=629 /DNA_ORIENTATION=+
MTVIGAAFQAIVFIVNATLLLCFQPYKSDDITRTEGALLMALFLLLWCAVLKELLEKHKDAAAFADVISRANTLIELLAILVCGVVILLPLYMLLAIARKAFDLAAGPDEILNKLYMMQYVKKEKERKEAETNRLRDLMEGDKDEDVVQILAAKLPQLDEALTLFKEMGLDGHIDLGEQKRLLVRLAKVVRRIEEVKQRRCE